MSNHKKKIGLISNTFNIGNHFFEQSLLSDLKSVFDDVANIVPIEGRSVFNELRMTGKSTQYLDIGPLAKLDYIVFSGPIFQGQSFRRNFKALIDHASKRGTKFLFLSTGSISYTKEERELMKEALAESNLLALSTRDAETYDAYADMFQFAHNGICSAFFVSKHFPGYKLEGIDPYIVMNFEEAKEPEIPLTPNGDIDINRLIKIAKTNHPDGLPLWSILQRRPGKIGKYKVIRTYHTVAPSLNKVLTRAENMFVSPNPFSYLSIFQNADFVMARRVHACVPSLSYGTPAMLFNKTKRAKIFERVGLGAIHEKLTTLDQNVLDAEHGAFRDFLFKIKHVEFSQE